LALQPDIEILAHPVCKMLIFYELKKKDNIKKYTTFVENKRRSCSKSKKI